MKRNPVDLDPTNNSKKIKVLQGSDSLNKSSFFERNTPTINDLPADIVKEIVKFLFPKDLSAIGATSTYFKKLTNDDWQFFNNKIWGITQTNSNQKSLFLKKYNECKNNLHYSRNYSFIRNGKNHVNLIILIKLEDAVGIKKILRTFFKSKTINYRVQPQQTPYSIAINTNNLIIVKLIFGHREKNSGISYSDYLKIAFQSTFEIAQFIAKAELSMTPDRDSVSKGQLKTAIETNNLPMVKWIVDKNLEIEKLDNETLIKLIEFTSRNCDISLTLTCAKQLKTLNETIYKEKLNSLIQNLNATHFDIIQFLIEQFEASVTEENLFHIFTLSLKLEKLDYAKKLLENIHDQTKALLLALEAKCEEISAHIIEFQPIEKNTLHQGNSLLSLAAKQGMYNAAVRLIANRSLVAGVNKTDLPLLRAVEGKCYPLIQLLLEKKAPLDAQQEDGKTALHIAAEIGRLDIIELLLTHGADVDKLTELDATNTKHPAWHLAGKNGHWNACFYLLKKTKYLAGQENSPIPLHFVVEHCQENIARWLIENKADINLKASHGSTALHRAAEKGHLAMAKLLVAANINIHIKISPTHSRYPNALACEIASMNGHLQVAEYLLVHGITTDPSIYDSLNVYEWAKKNNCDDVLNLLLEREYAYFIAYNKLFDFSGSPYLQSLLAIQENDLQELQELLNNNVIDINHATITGVLLLKKALKFKHFDIVAYLLENGAKPDLNDIEIIIQNHHWTSIKIIFELIQADLLDLSPDFIKLLDKIKTYALEDVQCSPMVEVFQIQALFEQHEQLLDSIEASANSSQESPKQKTNFRFFEEPPTKKQKTEAALPSKVEKSEGPTF